MHAVYANLFGAPAGDLLLTEEIALARTAPRSLIVDRLLDTDAAERLNALIWRLAGTWGEIGGPDPSHIAGVSAIDLATAEVAITALVPAARGLLGMQAALREHRFDALTAVVPLAGAGHHERIESVQAGAAVAAARSALGPELRVLRRAVHDPRNAALAGKYARTRDIDQLAAGAGRGARGAAERAVLAAVDGAGRARERRRHADGRPRRAAVVLEYNPTRAFARGYGAAGRPLRLLRGRPDRHDLLTIVRAGDGVLVPPAVPRDLRHDELESRLRAAIAERGEALGRAFTWEGVALWPLLAEPLVASAVRLGAYLETAAPALRRQLEQARVAAVLVPFDTPPEARALVRVAQTAGVGTLVLSDGFKADDFSLEGSSTDVALAWSDSMAEHYFSRWPRRRTVVTGNPRADRPRAVRPRRAPSAGPPRHILVGSFTFSPIDLLCRRSDAETFIEEIFAGIAAADLPRAPRVTLKLHPADEPGHYADALARHRRLAVEVVRHGDVLDLFAGADLYVTTYSTSLIEAVPLGMPVLYYRVNAQRLHPPFRDDDLLAPRTAESPAALATLLEGPLARADGYGEADLAAWAARYLGPADGGSVGRVSSVLEEVSRSRSAVSRA